MNVPRRITLQLTPLLDLLLIVIFAQYLEMSEQQAVANRRQQVTVSAVTDERDAAHAAAEASRNQLRQAGEALEELAARLQATQQDAEQLAGNRDDEAQRRRQTEAQLAAIGRVVKMLYESPAVRAAAEQLDTPAGQAQTVREKVDEFARRNPSAIIRHLLEYDEIRKRCDVWEVHLDESGVTQITSGDIQFAWRATSADEFASELYRWYKTIPQPKGLVLILVTYGDTPANWRAALLEGVPQAAVMMRDDARDRTRFEFATLGYRPAAASVNP